jgi:hypothetical protein
MSKLLWFDCFEAIAEIMSEFSFIAFLRNGNGISFHLKVPTHQWRQTIVFNDLKAPLPVMIL